VCTVKYISCINLARFMEELPEWKQYHIEIHTLGLCCRSVLQSWAPSLVHFQNGSHSSLPPGGYHLSSISITLNIKYGYIVAILDGFVNVDSWHPVVCSLYVCSWKWKNLLFVIEAGMIVWIFHHNCGAPRASYLIAH